MNEEYAYIVGWVNHHSRGFIKSLEELKAFVFRQMTNEEIERFGEEPLKIAWERLSIKEKAQLEKEIEFIYQK